MSLKSRFESKCGPAQANGCVLWTGSSLPKGYGLLRIKRDDKWINGYAHRVAWELKHGDIPQDMNVLHRCDNPACVNVEHLFLGTQKDNLHDMASKGRHALRQGEWNGLNSTDDERIRDLRRAGCTQQQIADWLGTSTATVSFVLSGKLNHSPAN